VARQIGEYRFVGTTEDGLCFYKMEGEYYVRRKSCLTGKMFRTRKCFEGSRRSAARLARGSQLAALVYARFEKQADMYKQLKSRAIGLLKKEMAEDEIIDSLFVYAEELQPQKLNCRKKGIHKVPTPTKKENSLFILLPIASLSHRFRRFRSTA
jgi:hypothetical protein